MTLKDGGENVPMQVSWPTLIAAAIVAAVVSGIISWSLQARVGPPGPPGSAGSAGPPGPQGSLDRLDRKVFPVRLRRRAASALKSDDGAIAWAEQFAAPAADCH